MPVRTLITFLLLLLLVSPATAQDQDAAASDWQGLIDRWLSTFNADHEDMTLSLEGMTLETKGAEEGAQLGFDALVLRYGEVGVARSGPGGLDLAEAEEGLIAFGPARLASPITVLKLPGAKPLTLDFDLMELDGLVDRDGEVLHRLALQLEDLTARRGDRTPLQASRMALQTEVTPQEMSRYDQSSLLSLQGVTLDAPDGTLGVERLVARLTNEGVDPDALLAWGERLQAAESGRSRDPLPPLGALWRQSGGSLLLAGLWGKDKAGAPLFWLEDLRLESAMARGSALDRMTVTLLLEGGGLDFSQSSDAKLSKAAGLVPTAWRLPLVVEDLPSEALGSLLLDMAAGGSPQKGPVIDPDRQVDFEPFLQALRRAGSRLVVEDLLIEGPAGAVKGGGAVTLDRRHPLGMVGEATFYLSGIKQAEEALQGSDDPEVAKIGFLVATFLKGLGEAMVGDDGQIVYRYALEFREDGSSLLNGLALDSLLQR